MVSCKAFNLLPSGFLITIVLMHYALPWSTTADSTPLVARSGGVLKVLVPIKTDFKEFVDCAHDSNVKGFCIDVFKNALSILIPKPSWTDVEYQCYQIGADSYDTMVDLLAASKDIDAVVGDITISAARSVNASFTQTYLDSGIVTVAPVEGVSQSFLGVFFAPFTIQTWAFILGSFLLAGSALWLLEHNNQPSLQEAQSGLEQLKSIFWFVTSILIFFKRDSIKNPLTKFVIIDWILFSLLVGSSYTASLSSILTVNELSKKSLTMNDLLNMNMTVGYQVGSIVKSYLERRHNITNLKALYNATQYADALRSKEVVAVVDEIPYISLFLAAQSALNCKFSVSKKLTIEGLGFAFYDKNLSAAFSVAILNLSESGQIQTIQDGWKLSNFQCPSRIQATRLDFRSSKGLFVILGAAMVVCIGIFIFKHVVFPCLVQTYRHLRANEQQGATELALSDANFSSARTDFPPDEDPQSFMAISPRTAA